MAAEAAANVQDRSQTRLHTQTVRCIRSFRLRLLDVPSNSHIKKQPFAGKLAQSVFLYGCCPEHLRKFYKKTVAKCFRRLYYISICNI